MRNVMLALALAVGLCAALLAGGSVDAAGPAVDWGDETLVIEVQPGQVADATTELTFAADFDGTFTFDIDKKLDGIVFAPPPTVGVAAPGVSGPVSFAAVAAGDAEPLASGSTDCSHEGQVKLRYQAAGKTDNGVLPRHLDVCVRVVAAADRPIPSEMVSPSPDRVATNDAGRRYVVDELVIGLPMGTSDPWTVIEQLAADHGGVVIGAAPAAFTYQVRFPERGGFESLGDLREELTAGTVAEFASRQYLTDETPAVPDDPEWDGWDESNPAGNNWNLELIGMPSAWDLTTGDVGVDVAVLDLGFHGGDHDDLGDNVGSVSGRDSSGDHGEGVAGIACAQGDNAVGISGVAWDCDLSLYGVANNRFAFLPDDFPPGTALDRMIDAVDDGAEIVNMSLAWIDTNETNSSFDPDETREAAEETNDILARGMLYALFADRDVLWVLAAGNENRDVQFQSPASLTARFPLNVITVAAVDPSGDKSDFSNFGELVSVAAPGGRTLTTVQTECRASGFLWLGETCDSNYRADFGGTSGAAPHVAGLAALVRSANPDATASDLKECIVGAAEGQGADIPGQVFNLIDAPSAVECNEVVDLPAEVDIVFAVDLTGSMGAELFRLKDEIGQIMNDLTTSVSPTTDFRFGVVSFEDYNGTFDSSVCDSSDYGSVRYGADSKFDSSGDPTGDTPFRFDEQLTGDVGAVEAAIDRLELGFGGDGPESYGRVLWQLGQDGSQSFLGFRADALKLVIMTGDNVPHDGDLNEGFEGAPIPDFDTGIEPGSNNTIDCGGDDIDFQDDALTAVIEDEIRLLYIDSSGNPDFPKYWTYWSSLTGGAAAAINTDGSIPGGLDLTDLIVDLLQLSEF